MSDCCNDLPAIFSCELGSAPLDLDCCGNVPTSLVAVCDFSLVTPGCPVCCKTRYAPGEEIQFRNGETDYYCKDHFPPEADEPIVVDGGL